MLKKKRRKKKKKRRGRSYIQTRLTKNHGSERRIESREGVTLIKMTKRGGRE